MTPDFGTVNNLFNMASNGEVIFMKEFRIVDMNIFEVWAIAIWSHLEGRSCVWNTEILYSEHYSTHYAPKTASYGKMIYMDCLRLVEAIDLDIRIVPIRVHMQKLEPSEYSTITSQKWRAPPDTLSDG